MRRVIAWLSLPLAVAVCLWTWPAAAPAAQPKVQGPGCKPEAPIAVTLEPDGGVFGVVRATFSLRPLLEMSALQWSWELSPDVRLVEGEAAGTAEAARDATTERGVGLQIPNDGRHHTARLVVTGLLARGGEEGEPEPVTVTRTLSWGEPDPVTPLVWSPDADTGTLVRVAAVPTTHTPAPSRPAGR
jgi:hypothetical protein